MKILIIGSGGREHAILEAVSKSERVSKIFVAPGNPGMKDIATLVDIDVNKITKLRDFAIENNIDLTIVGPEVPLVLGIADLFEDSGLRILGVNKDCAQFEGSKDFTKEFLVKYNIPTAKYLTFTEYEKAVDNIGIFGFPMVIKADGLAAGKGVIIAENGVDAEKALHDIMIKKVFGISTVVIEEFLEGIEASIICFVDSKTIVPLETAKDFKKAYDNDEGPNTGGMGAFSPSNIIDENLNNIIDATILQPIMSGFIKENLNYKGILFIGIMIKTGIPKVLEFNVRFGDPETQVILPRLKTDIIDIFDSIIDEKLSEITINWSDKKAVCVVLTSGGYPNDYTKGYEITGFNDIKSDIKAYHAGTKTKDSKILTNGGRVINLVCLENSIDLAREKVYSNIDKINFEGKTFRTDIAKI